jgi:hypothetical protein
MPKRMIAEALVASGPWNEARASWIARTRALWRTNLSVAALVDVGWIRIQLTL